MTSNFRDSVTKRGLLGIEYGVALALVFIIVAGGIWMASDTAPLADYGISFGTLALLYLTGGVVGGGIGGTLFPFASTRWGAFFVGSIAASPFVFMLTFLAAEELNNAVIASVLSSMALGGTLGIMILHPAAQSS